MRKIKLFYPVLVAGVITFSAVVFLLAKDKASYHLNELRRLNSEDLTFTYDGLAIDNTVEQAKFHRDQLVKLGVMFRDSFDVGNRQEFLKSERQLVAYLEAHGPKGGYWELSENKLLTVWDFADSEAQWRKFVASVCDTK